MFVYPESDLLIFLKAAICGALAAALLIPNPEMRLVKVNCAIPFNSLTYVAKYIATKTKPKAVQA